MPVAEVVYQLKMDRRPDTLYAVFRKAKLERKPVRLRKRSADMCGCKQIRVSAKLVHRIAAVVFIKANSDNGANPEGTDIVHNSPKGRLLPVLFGKLFRPLQGDALDLCQLFRLGFQYLQCLLPKRFYNGSRQHRADASNHTVREVLKNIIGGRWRDTVGKFRLELRPVGGMRHPAPGCEDLLPGRKERETADHCLLEVIFILQLQNRVSVFRIAVEDGRNRPVQFLQFQLLLSHISPSCCLIRKRPFRS